MNQKSFRDQLKNIKRDVKKSSEASLPFSANEWVKDGVDHINIARHGETQLGRILNLDYVRNWEHPILGPFRSLNSLWFFLRAKNRSDAIRNLSGNELRSFVETECGGFGDHLYNFRGMILDSMYKRIKMSREFTSELIQTVVPFDSYRKNEAGIRIRFEQSFWIVLGYEEIRRALKEKREPDFTGIPGFIQVSQEELYKPILEKLVRNTSEAEIEKLMAKKKADEKKLRRELHRRAQEEAEKAKVSSIGQIQDIDNPPVVEETKPEDPQVIAEMSSESTPEVLNDSNTQDQVIETASISDPVVEIQAA